ncbi:MAG: hypothetical protein KC635_22295 [Myxococcales bacterium]|nr:hypothetical protein [Myxococcales bacterium]MCB9735616.1 hypothetical protein [Deltaproteobacteria bacterium]
MRLASATARLALVASLLVGGAGVSRADTSDELYNLVRDDLTALGVNLPVWMSQHLPGVMGSSGLGAGIELSDSSGGFSLGVVARMGLLNNFKDVGYGLELIDIRSEMPDLVPWPQIGIVAGFSLGHGLELGADIEFIPDMDIAGDNVDLHAGLISVAGSLRWRANHAEGLVPAVILGVGLGYYGGTFELGAHYESGYSETVDGHTAVGTYTANAAPGTSWHIFQVAPELRIAWDIGGVFRPYLGFGVGFSFGNVADHAHVRATLTVDTIDGQPVNQDPIVYDDDIVLFETSPALYTLRPHVGFDLVLGIFALTVQAELAVMGADKIDGNFSSAAGTFDVQDDNYLYSKSSEGSQSNAAAILSVAARFQFE